jgi:hypothetical protein
VSESPTTPRTPGDADLERGDGPHQRLRPQALARPVGQLPARARVPPRRSRARATRCSRPARAPSRRATRPSRRRSGPPSPPRLPTASRKSCSAEKRRRGGTGTASLTHREHGQAATMRRAARPVRGRGARSGARSPPRCRGWRGPRARPRRRCPRRRGPRRARGSPRRRSLPDRRAHHRHPVARGHLSTRPVVETLVTTGPFRRARGRPGREGQGQLLGERPSRPRPRGSAARRRRRGRGRGRRGPRARSPAPAPRCATEGSGRRGKGPPGRR